MIELERIQFVCAGKEIMSEPKPAGPFDVLPLPGGGSAPLYLIPYDEKGRCEGPGTLERLISEARSGGYNHIYVFSHGWNNVFKDAVTLYRDFFTGYLDLWRQSD